MPAKGVSQLQPAISGSWKNTVNNDAAELNAAGITTIMVNDGQYLFAGVSTNTAFTTAPNAQTQIVSNLRLRREIEQLVINTSIRYARSLQRESFFDDVSASVTSQLVAINSTRGVLGDNPSCRPAAIRSQSGRAKFRVISPFRQPNLGFDFTIETPIVIS